MKAWLLKDQKGLGSMKIGDAFEPHAVAGEAVVELFYATLNPADRYLAEGMYPARLTLPHILGRDGVGKVIEVGPGIAGAKIGEIASVNLQDGVATVTMKVVPKYARIYRNATLLLRPKTQLQDITIQVNPGTPAAGKLKSARSSASTRSSRNCGPARPATFPAPISRGGPARRYARSSATSRG